LSGGGITRVGRSVRRLYTAAAEGRAALKVVRARVREIFGEMIERR
jgi:hypothetical protein